MIHRFRLIHRITGKNSGISDLNETDCGSIRLRENARKKNRSKL